MWSSEDTARGLRWTVLFAALLWTWQRDDNILRWEMSLRWLTWRIFISHTTTHKNGGSTLRGATMGHLVVVVVVDVADVLVYSGIVNSIVGFGEETNVNLDGQLTDDTIVT